MTPSRASRASDRKRARVSKHLLAADQRQATEVVGAADLPRVDSCAPKDVSVEGHVLGRIGDRSPARARSRSSSSSVARQERDPPLPRKRSQDRGRPAAFASRLTAPCPARRSADTSAPAREPRSRRTWPRPRSRGGSRERQPRQPRRRGRKRPVDGLEPQLERRRRPLHELVSARCRGHGPAAIRDAKRADESPSGRVMYSVVRPSRSARTRLLRPHAHVSVEIRPRSPIR